MNQSSTLRAGRSTILFNRLKTYLSKPYNVILLLMGIVVTVTTFAPIAAIIQDTITIHPGTIDAHLTGQAEGYTLVNYIRPLYKQPGKDQPLDPADKHPAHERGRLRCVHTLRRHHGLPRHEDEPGLPQIPEQHLYLPLHHAAVDSRRRVAEPLQLQRRHRHLQRPAGRHAGHRDARLVVRGAVSERYSPGTALRPLRLHPDRRHFPQHGRQP